MSNTLAGPNGQGTIQSLPRVSYKISESAKIVGVSEISIRRAIQRGLLKPCRAFRHVLIPADQLKRLVEGGN